MNNQDYRLKYNDLKLKFHDAIDVAFRLGFEQGGQQAQMQQAQQQQAEAEAQQAAAMGQQPGAEGQDPNTQPDQDMPGQEPTDGSELDQHIGHLESMLQKSEQGSSDFLNFKKSLDGIKAFKNDLKQKHDLFKNEKAIKAIGKALKPQFTLSKSATKNMSQPAQKALSMQEQIVADLMKSMADEEAKALESVNKELDFERVLKG